MDIYDQHVRTFVGLVTSRMNGDNAGEELLMESEVLPAMERGEWLQLIGAAVILLGVLADELAEATGTERREGLQQISLRATQRDEKS